MVKPVDTKVEELRVLSSTDENSAAKEWITPEFVSLVGTVAGNVITVATVLGWLDANGAQELTKAVTTILTAVGTISVNGFIVWKYLASRTAVKTEQIIAQYKYAEAVAIERMRVERTATKR